ncbi:MAG: alanine dehydrogenase, partial [Gammaproteobacteria bacterium]|nr:alanine dehydrogenase [Gammaproteobacteria bacterium]
MLKAILRKEHKNRWERRVALTPDSVAELHSAGLRIDIENCNTRVFSNASYLAAGAELVQTPDRHDLVLGIKEPPITSIQTDQLHLCFSHTIKGQDYNMPLLQKFIDQRATLIDYELMTNEQGMRTIAFGRYAGIAGAIDTLWLYVKKLRLNGRVSCLEGLKQTWEYKTLAEAEQALQRLDT